jgi:hypothetical protein
MQILNLAIVPKQIGKILLARLLVDIGRDDDPALDAADGDGVGRGFGLGGGLGFGAAAAVVGSVGGLVDFHFGRHGGWAVVRGEVG